MPRHKRTKLAPAQLIGPSLMDITLDLLDKSGLSNSEMTDLFGMQIGWKLKVLNGKIKEPGVEKIQLIYEHLTGKPLFPKVD